MDLLAGIGAGLQGLGALSTGIESVINRTQQRKLQKETWAREDNAVSRRVADLKAAGLSPTLAAGSAAASSAPIHLDSTQVGSALSGIGRVPGAALELEAQEKALAQQDATLNATRQSARYEALQAEALDMANLLPRALYGGKPLDVISPYLYQKLEDTWSSMAMDMEIKHDTALQAKYAAQKAQTDAEEAQRNLDMAKEEGIRTNLPAGMLGQAAGTMELVRRAIQSMFEGRRRK